MLKRLLLVTIARVIGACTPPPPLPTDRGHGCNEAKLKADLQRWMDDFNAGNADV